MTDNAFREWQPIETAPKDREILIFDTSGRQRVCQWVTAVEDGTGAWIYGRRLSPIDPVAFFVEHPTHWRLLPSPPADA